MIISTISSKNVDSSNQTANKKVDNKRTTQRNKKSQTEIELNVNFLDESTQTFNLKKRSTGADLLNQAFDHLTIEEREYFGIERIHNERPEPFINWIDPNKPLIKYVTKDERQNCKLQFRVKYFATDPSRLHEECTRHQFYLQIRRDIYSAKLNCSLITQCLLVSYIVQAELGDYDSFDHQHNYLRDLKLIPNQTEEMEQRISANHKILAGIEKDEAEYNYLEHAMKIPLYGVYFFKSKDSTGKDIDLGITSLGVIVYQNDHVVNEFSWSKMVKISFKRRTFFIELKRELSEDYNTMLGFKLSSHRHAKIVWKTCVEHHSFFRLAHNATSSSTFASKSTSKSSKNYFSSHKGSVPIDRHEQSRKQFTKAAKIHNTIAENRLNEKVSSAAGSNGSSNGNNGNNGKLSLLSITKSYKTYDNKVTSKQIETIPRMAWEQQVPHETVALQPIPVVDPLYSSHLNTKHLITVSMQADEIGRFGFNIRGGIDLNLPVLVALIAPNSPADRVLPKIKEGDEVLFINGHDVNGLTHEQVVNLIKSTRDHNPNAQLVLTIKPSVEEFVGTGEEEPMCQYVPDTCIDQSIKYDGDEFTQSLLLLHDGLASGALLDQFETLYKKNKELTIIDAELERNLCKNRYRDILPYDYNRIKIAQATDIGTDYINANYVNMKIPNDCINRYIATQGPMENTVLDFWRMIQQENSTLIIMLTTILERGRQKCFAYWPQSKQEQIKLSPTFSITLLSEFTDETESYVLRRIALNDNATGEYREIRQLQYLSWPDHGVPSDRTLFMNFVNKIREMRQHSMDNIDQRFNQLQLLDADASDVSPEEICKRYNKVDSDDEWIPLSVHQYISAANPPIIVHCSAGIGRTGMLILLDTALSLLSIDEPVYPLDIVRHMRDQRPFMVQNVFQYKFICECIFETYDKLIKENNSPGKNVERREDDEPRNGTSFNA